MGRPLRRLRRVEHDRRGSRRPRRRPRRAHPRPRPRPPHRPRRPRHRGAASRRAPSPASPSSTASSAAASCPPRRSSSAATPASASRPSSSRPPPPSRRAAPRPSTSPARRPPPRSASAPPASASTDAPLKLATETNLRDILTTLEAERPALAILDSIQTLWADHVDSAPGLRRPGPRRRPRARHLRQAPRHRHRPRRPRHQGRPDRRPPRRRAHGRHRPLLRGRARPPVPHPARRQEPLRPRRRDRRLRDDRRAASPRWRTPPRSSSPSATPATSGSAVFAGIEGTRPLLVEIQALVAPSAPGTAAPHRRRLGLRRGSPWSSPCSKSRCGIGFGPSDVYLNVAGGLRISEPAADLAVAAALVSARQDIPLPRDAVVFGEICLSGALRPAPQAEARLREAAKLGFGAAWLPATAQGDGNGLADPHGCGSRRFHGQVLRHRRGPGHED